MPSTSKKQHNFMAAIANSPEFAKKAGVPVKVGKEFMKADKGRKFKEGGETMKHSDISKDKPMMKKIAKEEVKSHEKKMHGKGYAKGGVTRADGCVSKGHTKGKMIKMMSGGKC